MAIKLPTLGPDSFDFMSNENLYETSPQTMTEGSDDGGAGSGGGTGTSGTGTGGNTQTPCAPGYKKEFKSDGSFECVPENQEPPCAYDSNGNYVTDTSKRERVASSECQRRFDLNIKNNPNESAPPGGTSGSSGGGAPAPPKQNWEPWTAPGKTPFELDLEKQLSEFLNGWSTDVPFTPGVIGDLKTDAFRATKGRSLAEQRAIEADSIRRGVLRSTGTDRRIDAQRNAAASEYAAAERSINTTATQANFQARTQNRLAALDRAEAHVNAEREYLMANEMNHFARQQGMNQLALAYYNIANQRYMLKMQLDQNASQFGASLDWQKQWAMLQQLLAGFGG